jgi:hypothetical protein
LNLCFFFNSRMNEKCLFFYENECKFLFCSFYFIFSSLIHSFCCPGLLSEMTHKHSKSIP